MAGATQRNYRHALPKSARVHSPRINLTFRRISNARVSDRAKHDATFTGRSAR